ncbi:glycosyltransferase family 4 protein [Terracoccus sp. 273MFTsu3.1]|uniref:glycosyltransferase family 4 protein n=1 Tax=Terracoccus sp. 273MFTsu3.1 TaxID=1172188 RepID=UPI00037DD183|nr:glycosyltransferase family 4 protein [Terracoccus sp. 273MFTsu3.1]
MRALSEVHAVVPAGIDDPLLPSGGNTYDRRVLDGLRSLGWQASEHPVPGSWPRPDAAATARLAEVVAAVPTGSVLLVDGLVASAADTVLVPAADRIRLVVVVHLPLGAADPSAAAVEGAVLAVAAAVVTTSGWTRDVLLDAYGLAPAAVHVARPGVDRAPVAPRGPGGGRLICVGAVTALKGQADLLAALTLVEDLPWSCVLVGALTREPDVVDGLRRQLASAGLGDRAHLVGPRVGADLERTYAAADLLVLPSHVETYGMVVTEALARGIPVLATDVGGVREAFGPTGEELPGLLVPAASPEALAAALRSWLTDGALRDRLRRNALARRETLSSWSETTGHVSAVLERVGGR